MPAVDAFGKWLTYHLEVFISESQVDLSRVASALAVSHEDLTFRLQNIRKKKFETKTELIRRVYLSVKYIEEHTLSPFDLDDAAESACLSKFHFLRIFKQVMGTTPWEYHQRFRMQYARRCILHGEMALSALSERLGYSQLSAFSKAFKDHFGVTPLRSRYLEYEDQN